MIIKLADPYTKESCVEAIGDFFDADFEQTLVLKSKASVPYEYIDIYSNGSIRIAFYVNLKLSILEAKYYSKVKSKVKSKFIYDKTKDVIVNADQTETLTLIPDKLKTFFEIRASLSPKNSFWVDLKPAISANKNVTGAHLSNGKVNDDTFVRFENLTLLAYKNSLYACIGNVENPKTLKYDAESNDVSSDVGVFLPVPNIIAFFDSLKSETKKVDKLLDGGAFEAINTNNQKFPLYLKSILKNMLTKKTSNSKLSILLGGDPGTGKTSIVRALSEMTGFPLIVIEAPHIVEEHLIKIPFLVMAKGKIERFTSTTSTVTDKDTEIDFSESVLITSIKNQQRTYQSFSALEKTMLNSKKAALFSSVSGYISALYNTNYTCILFIDEFYRAPINIINILRSTMNGFLGSEKLPDAAYVMYATNLLSDEGTSETGLTEKDSNNQFVQINIDTIPTEDFFGNIKHDFFDSVDDGRNPDRLPISADVFNAFLEFFRAENLKQNAEGVDDGVTLFDADSNIRLSPRRIKQILLFVNASLPCKSKKDAQALLSYVETNCTDYTDTAKRPSYYKDFMTVVIDLIKKSNPSIKGLSVKSTLSPTDWKDELDYHIQAKIKLGKDRSNVTVISGLPGIAKTKVAGDIADTYGLNLIYVDGSTLNPDDVLGIASINSDKSVSFSRPPLYDTVMSQYKSAKPSKSTSKYKHMLFLDEINRASRVETYNGLRSLMLEGKFNQEYFLPDDVLVVGAINPTSMANEAITEFTQHMRDVLDIIPCAPRYSEIQDYVMGKISNIKHCTEINYPNLTVDLLTVLKNFMDINRANVDDFDKSASDFYIYLTDDQTPMYLSPREIDEIVSGSVSNIVSALRFEHNFDPTFAYSVSDYEKFEAVCASEFSTHASQIFTSVLTTYRKSAKEASLVLNRTGGIVSHINAALKKNMFSGMARLVSETIKSVSTVCKLYNYDYDNAEFFDIVPSIASYHSNGDLLTSFTFDLENTVSDIIEKYKTLPDLTYVLLRFSLWVCDGIRDSLGDEAKKEYGADFYERVVEKLDALIVLAGAQVETQDELDAMLISNPELETYSVKWLTTHCVALRSAERKDFIDYVMTLES